MRFRYATGVLLHLAIGVGAGVSAAAEVQWINPAGGLYFVTPPNPSNWSPVAFPIATDTAIFNLGATYGVVFNAAPGKVGGVRVRQGGVSWLLGQQTLEVAPPSGPGVIVADTPGLAASLTLSGVGTVDGDYTQVAGPAGAVGTLNVVNAAHLKTTDLEVGVSGNGLLQIGPGSKVTSTSAEIGVHASGVGAATISGAGALWHVTDQNLIVGPAGHGDLAILNGGEVRVGDTPAGILNFASMWIGHGSATEVTALVAGAGSKLYTTGELRLAYVGPSSARLDVKSGGVVQSVWNGDFGRGSKATVVVQDPGSKLILGNTLELAGVGTSVSIVNGATGSASGLDIATLSGNDAALLLNGVGSKFSTQFESFVGHVGTGQVYVEGGAHLELGGVTRLGFDPTATGRILINGTGSKVTADSALLVGQLGRGEVLVQSGGRLDTNHIASISGDQTSIRVDGPNSVWNATSVFVGTGAPIAPTIEIGEGGSFHVSTAFEFTSHAHLTLSGSPLTGGRMTIGSVIGPTPALTLQIASDGILRGGGQIGGFVQSDGLIALGIDTNSSPTLTIAANYSQGANGILQLEIDDNNSGGFNRLAVLGTASLGGTLSIETTDDFVPQIGDFFDVVTFGSRSGSFDEILGLASPGNGLSLAHTWTSNSLRLFVASTGDSNFDDVVDGADYTVWADNYLKTGSTWLEGDFNGDFLVDGADYTLWADHYAPATVFSTAVPEPSTLFSAASAVALLGLLNGVRRSRQQA